MKSSEFKYRALVTTVPFASIDATPLKLLEEASIEYVINPLNKRLTEAELVELVPGYDILIAGTEPITGRVMDASPELKLISRVGIGLDSVDLTAAKERQISVCYTPDAPAPAVVELTLGLLFSLVRNIHVSNVGMHEGKWARYFGKRLSELTIGIIGVGRIGGRVAKNLSLLGAQKILLNDELPTSFFENSEDMFWKTKQEIYREADVITLHLPLTAETHNMIGEKELQIMKEGAFLINTARGGIINEGDLYNAISNGKLGGAAIDVFTNEPYDGRLRDLPQCLLTCHMGSMSADCRTKMEVDAVREAVRMVRGIAYECPVPKQEYDAQRLMQ